MTATEAAIPVSPVNTEARKNLGIKVGDTVRVYQKIQEKGKTRIQLFEGLVLARKHGNEAGATFTVRKVVDGIGVERIFPLYSPLIDRIEIIRRAKVRRAKLYYIREKVAREIKRQMRKMQNVHIKEEVAVPEETQEQKAETAEESAEAQEQTTAVETVEETKAEEESPKETKVGEADSPEEKKS